MNKALLEGGLSLIAQCKPRTGDIWERTGEAQLDFFGGKPDGTSGARWLGDTEAMEKFRYIICS
ncbi:hypothetical protein SAMN05216378_5307 [Paenibacillus catalpae]|uniref:Uncharacterized protein n=1 Tax=Paenibacillus catalpae TaxID=1045775 RepID=A0A1I2GLB5_9BACL|nr:hypothetical protein [Paenibacillus catalpae]SFF17819.1 hypothetical protein SAMN05216378_5307 [Paenibacillus catalpae]